MVQLSSIGMRVSLAVASLAAFTRGQHCKNRRDASEEVQDMKVCQPFPGSLGLELGLVLGFFWRGIRQHSVTYRTRIWHCRRM